jgi:hypothetical protein
MHSIDEIRERGKKKKMAIEMRMMMKEEFRLTP